MNNDMEPTPNFETLRTERNRRVMESHQRLADELGLPLSSVRTNFNPNACYCACTTGGPCEHQLDGAGVEFDDGAGWSVTCSRCGCTAIGHDMRVLP